MTFKSGRTLQGGRYIIETLLGRGGFGVTYRALHAPLGLTVVIKTLQERLRRSPQYPRFRNQLLTEAQTLANFQHPSIVRVIDLFEEDQYPCVVMEYIPGMTLGMLAKPGQPLEESFAVYYIRQIATALSVIHAKGFVHRDVKPKNILRRDGNHRAILIDFGIAQTPDPSQPQTRALSAHYAPPEQYQANRPLTPAADVYALSATLYFLLTGQAPVPASRRDRIQLRPISEFQSQLTAGLEQAIFQGMTLNPDQRPQSIKEWLNLIPRAVPTPIILADAKPSLLERRSPKKRFFQARKSDPNKEQTRLERSVTQPATLKAKSKAQRRSIPFSQHLATTALLASVIGGSLAVMLRVSSSSNKPLLTIEQTFPDKAKWPGSFPGSEVPFSLDRQSAQSLDPMHNYSTFEPISEDLDYSN